MTYYEIFDALTGELIVRGNSKECKEALNCSSMDTFYALANRAKRGINKKYRVNVVKGGLADYPVLGKYDPEYHEKGKLTPLEKALLDRDEIDYCDECEFAVAIKNTGYCKVSGKIIHPIMYDRNIPGTGPARNCQNRKKMLAEIKSRKG